VASPTVPRKHFAIYARGLRRVLLRTSRLPIRRHERAVKRARQSDPAVLTFQQLPRKRETLGIAQRQIRCGIEQLELSFLFGTRVLRL
jgi:hypothetical protein